MTDEDVARLLQQAPLLPAPANTQVALLAQEVLRFRASDLMSSILHGRLSGDGEVPLVAGGQMPLTMAMSCLGLSVVLRAPPEAKHYLEWAEGDVTYRIEVRYADGESAPAKAARLTNEVEQLRAEALKLREEIVVMTKERDFCFAENARLLTEVPDDFE